MKRNAEAYLLDAKIYITAKKKTTMGLEFFSEPIKILSHTDDPKFIGVAVRESLASFMFNQKQLSKDEMKVHLQPLLDLAGVKTSKAFFTKVKSVPISLENEVITFYPTINKGWKDGFHKPDAPNIQLPEGATDSDLGVGLLKAFDDSSIA